MSIFATPVEIDNSTGIKILFLHGLDGTPEGEKAVYLKTKWGAKVPALRTNILHELRSKHAGIEWKEMPKTEFRESWNKIYQDALCALNYEKPDVIIGSSMGGALLAKLIVDGHWSGNSIFLAPAIQPLLGEIVLPEMRNSVWILGEMDDVVTNGPNICHCLRSGGSLMVVTSDGHRLHKALSTGLIDNAIATVVEISHLSSII